MRKGGVREGRWGRGQTRGRERQEGKTRRGGVGWRGGGVNTNMSKRGERKEGEERRGRGLFGVCASMPSATSARGQEPSHAVPRERDCEEDQDWCTISEAP